MNMMKITCGTKNKFPRSFHPHLEHMAIAYKQALRDTLDVIRNMPESDTVYVDTVAASLEVSTPKSLLTGTFVKEHADLFSGDWL